MKVVVVGGGKVGYYLTKTLLEHGHNPIIIDINKNTCINLANDLDIPVIAGDGTTIQVLEIAQLRDADVIVGVTDKDENNLITCQLAKKYFNIQRTVAKVNNPKNTKILKQLGVDTPISSTDNIVRLLERELNTGVIKQLLSLNSGEVSLIEFDIPKTFKCSGVKLMNFNMPSEAVIVAVYHDDKMVIPRGNSQIFIGDRLVILIKDICVNELYDTFNLKEKDVFN